MLLVAGIAAFICAGALETQPATIKLKRAILRHIRPSDAPGGQSGWIGKRHLPTKRERALQHQTSGYLWRLST
jgi:hypothetical protein